MLGVVFKLATKRITPNVVTVIWLVIDLLSTKGMTTSYFFLPLPCAYLSIPWFYIITKKIDIPSIY